MRFDRVFSFSISSWLFWIVVVAGVLDLGMTIGNFLMSITMCQVLGL